MSHSPIITGIDEAGRGALAGPVVAGACVLGNDVLKVLQARSNPYRHWRFKNAGRRSPTLVIADSKKLTPEERNHSYEWIVECCSWGVGIGTVDEIESLGILGATEKAMQRAVEMLAEKMLPTYLLVDGRDAFCFDYPHTSIIRGDESEPCIAAASILAKVTRDRLMLEHHAEFPAYGFQQHKGYGTEYHQHSILQHGPCPLHRAYFLRNMLSRASALSSHEIA